MSQTITDPAIAIIGRKIRLVRQDLNNAIEYLWTLASGATEPTTKKAYQFWADTTAAFLRQRNSGNTAWIPLWALGANPLAITPTSVLTTTPFTMDPTTELAHTYRGDSTAGALAWTMPDAATYANRIFNLVQVAGANNITLTPARSDTWADGSGSKNTSAKGDVLSFFSIGTEWFEL